MKRIDLGVNIDHVATLRNARGGIHPDPVRAAHLAVQAGADSITVHLREDRRHISDHDVAALIRHTDCRINLEMAATPEMLAIAQTYRPFAVCLVPEKRQERTTEGGLNLSSLNGTLPAYIRDLQAYGIRVSLFINPDAAAVALAAEMGADVVELHTGAYCDTHHDRDRQAALAQVKAAAEAAHHHGLICHAGHGLSYATVREVAMIPQISELNIGHYLMGEALFCGLETSIQKMRRILDEARGITL
jgi:pyridoxine 5-phosphate synthase